MFRHLSVISGLSKEDTDNTGNTAKPGSSNSPAPKDDNNNTTITNNKDTIEFNLPTRLNVLVTIAINKIGPDTPPTTLAMPSPVWLTIVNNARLATSPDHHGPLRQLVHMLARWGCAKGLLKPVDGFVHGWAWEPQLTKMKTAKAAEAWLNKTGTGVPPSVAFRLERDKAGQQQKKVESQKVKLAHGSGMFRLYLSSSLDPCPLFTPFIRSLSASLRSQDE